MQTIEIHTTRADEEIVVTTRHKWKEPTPSFICLGVNMDFETREPNYPELVKVLKDLSKSGTWFLWSLVENRNQNTNVAKFQPKDSMESQRITRAYKELSGLGMVIRVHNKRYLINPIVIFPNKGKLQDVRKVWEMEKLIIEGKQKEVKPKCK